MPYMTKNQVHDWLIDYVWAEDTQDAKERVIGCILSQDGWQYIDAKAEQFAGAQWEPGPAAFDEGVGFALSALYECHDEPHLPTCPDVR